MQLGLHGVQVIVHVLAETYQEGKGLIHFFAFQVLLNSEF
jgi:hypothetical protein